MAGLFERIGSQVAQKFTPKLSLPTKISRFMPAAQKLLQGDFSGAASRLIDQLLGPLLGSSIAGRSLELAGGLTLAEVRQMFQQASATKYAKKNLWFLRITNLGLGGAPDINMFATDVSYTIHALTGDSVRVGSVNFATLTGTEPVEIRITTLDDATGTIKLWADALRYLAAHPDGTFGLPVDYLVRVEVTHASLVEDDTVSYTNVYTMRLGTIETDLNRREDALQEIALTFVEDNTFIPI